MPCSVLLCRSFRRLSRPSSSSIGPPALFQPSIRQKQTDMRSIGTMKQKKGDFEYCVDLVQNRDREAYLCGLLMPSRSRRSYFAVRAFNVELASIKDSSRRGQQDSDETTGGSSLALRIRMQWWKDALAIVYGDDESVGSSMPAGLGGSIRDSAYRNPVVRVLHDAVQESRLTRRFLERLLEARENDLDVSQIDTLEELKEYAEATSSSLLYLSLETTTDVPTEASDLCAQQAGIGIGLTTALRAARFRFVQAECSIPGQMLPPGFPYYKAGMEDPLDAMSVEEREQLEYAVRTLAVEAGSHLTEARDRQRDVPKESKQCFLPVVPSLLYLSKLEKAKYNVFDPSMLEQDRLTLLFGLSRTWLTGVF